MTERKISYQPGTESVLGNFTGATNTTRDITIEAITIAPPEVPELWFKRFAMEIRGPINRKGWKKGETTVIWQYNAAKKDFMAYKRDYSTSVLTPTFKAYTQKLKLAMADWMSLPESEKMIWRKKAKGRQLYGHNLFYRNWLKTH